MADDAAPGTIKVQSRDNAWRSYESRNVALPTSMIKGSGSTHIESMTDLEKISQLADHGLTMRTPVGADGMPMGCSRYTLAPPKSG